MAMIPNINELRGYLYVKDGKIPMHAFKGILIAAQSEDVQCRKLAATLIPKYSQLFPDHLRDAISTHINLCQDENHEVRITGITKIRGFVEEESGKHLEVVDLFSLFAMTLETGNERRELDDSLLIILNHDVKASLTALFKIVDERRTDRERILYFIKDKVLPRKDILKSKELESHMSGLIENSLQNVSRAEFKIFVDMLTSLKYYPLGKLMAIVGSQFQCKDDQIEWFMHCLFMAIPLFKRGASNTKYLLHFRDHILPKFDELSGDTKTYLLRGLAESSPFTTPQDVEIILPSVVQILKKCSTFTNSSNVLDATTVECLLYTLQHLVDKTPNGQPSKPSNEIEEEDFKNHLKHVRELIVSCTKQLSNELGRYNVKYMEAITANDKAAQARLQQEKHMTKYGFRLYNNIFHIIKRLLGDPIGYNVTPSWELDPKPSIHSNTGFGDKSTLPVSISMAAQACSEGIRRGKMIMMG